VKAHLTDQRNNGIRVCIGPPHQDGTEGNGLSKEKISKYKKEQKGADATATQQLPISQFKQPTRLGAASSRTALHPAQTSTLSSGLISDHLKRILIMTLKIMQMKL
jgi:hypothetical protein